MLGLGGAVKRKRMALRGPVDAVAVAQEVARAVSSGNASTIGWAVHSAVAAEVTFQWTTRPRSTESAKKT
jgi:hypothetical protein